MPASLSISGCPLPGTPADGLALKQISPERAEAIALCFFSELTYAEAGLVLQKSEAAAKMLVSRGLQDLRERTSLAFEVEL